jgi:predicted Fe-Mo cluster-binding NifX family protein
MKRLFVLGIVALLLCPVMVNAASSENNKIAVASDGKTVKSSVSNMAAKCPYYLLFDGTGTLTEVIDNPYKNASGGAGPSAAHFLAQKGVTMLIAENFGSKMIHALKSQDISHLQFEGTAGDAVKMALEGRQ